MKTRTLSPALGGALALSLWVAADTASAASALPEVQNYLVSSDAVTVSLKTCGFLCSYYLFEPTQPKPLKQGVVIYPGAFIASAAYAPLAYRVAEQGHYAALPRFLFNFALVAPARAGKVMAALPEVAQWALAGHSLGGVAASQYLDTQPAGSKVGGMFYLASYPNETNHLEDQSLQVVSLFGSEDGVLNRTKFEAAKDNLPLDTHYEVIAGGNHAQMGYYGEQKGDLPATISREAQQQIVLDRLLQLLAAMAAE